MSDCRPKMSSLVSEVVAPAKNHPLQNFLSKYLFRDNYLWQPSIDLISSCRHCGIWKRSNNSGFSISSISARFPVLIPVKIEPNGSGRDFILIFWSREGTPLPPANLPDKISANFAGPRWPKGRHWADLLPKVKDKGDGGRVSQELKVTLLHSKIVIFVRNIELLERHPQ